MVQKAVVLYQRLPERRHLDGLLESAQVSRVTP